MELWKKCIPKKKIKLKRNEKLTNKRQNRNCKKSIKNMKNILGNGKASLTKSGYIYLCNYQRESLS